MSLIEHFSENFPFYFLAMSLIAGLLFIYILYLIYRGCGGYKYFKSVKTFSLDCENIFRIAQGLITLKGKQTFGYFLDNSILRDKYVYKDRKRKIKIVNYLSHWRFENIEIFYKKKLVYEANDPFSFVRGLYCRKFEGQDNPNETEWVNALVRSYKDEVSKFRYSQT